MSGGGRLHPGEERRGPKSLSASGSSCGPLRGAGWGGLSQVWSLKGTRGLAAPVPPVVAQLVVLQGGVCPEV